MENDNQNLKWVFFGTTEFSVIVLDELKVAGFVPELIVTIPDKPKGRGLVLTPPPVKIWAEENQIEISQPETLGGLAAKWGEKKWDVFIVFSYGKIIPKAVLNISKHGTLNLHPSLLPKLRGPSPIKSAILKEDETGVSIIKLDTEMDHGPILAQKKVDTPEWPPYEADLENKLAHEGGKLLAEIMPEWVEGKIEAKEQDHQSATVCKKIEKEDGEINLGNDAEINLRKIRAFHVWPTAYFFDNDKRVIVKRAHIEDCQLVLERVVPEGKKEMDYKDYLRGNLKISN